MTRSVDTIIFDLDGTLVDSGPAMLEALRLAFVAEHLEPLDADTQRSLLGPPFYHSLPPLIGTEAAHRVYTRYREIFVETGLVHQIEVYDGIQSLLDRLDSDGFRLAVATSKSEPLALPLLESVGLAPVFDTICGDTPDAGRPSKAAVLAEVKTRFGGLDTALMVGDRRHDVNGASEHGVPCVGVGWGYGSQAELVEAGAAAFAPTVSELDAVLRGLVDSLRRS